MLVQRHARDGSVHYRLTLLRSTGECAFVSAIERDGVASVQNVRFAANNIDVESADIRRLRKRLRQCRSVDDVSTTITECFDARDRALKPANALSHTLSALRTELSAVGWQNVTDISERADTVTLAYRDAIDGALTVDLRIGHSGAVTVTRHSLPAPFAAASGARIADAYRQFVCAAQRTTDIRRVLRDWDDHCHIIGDTHSDPLKRVVTVGDIKLAVTHSADAPYALPDVRIIGNDGAAEPLRRKLHSLTLSQWSADVFPRVNLQAILAVEFAKDGNATTAAAVGDFECTICFSAVALDGSHADVTCSHARCSKLFHAECLYEWLKQLPTSTTTFNTIFGKCPHCQQTIQTSVRAGR